MPTIIVVLSRTSNWIDAELFSILFSHPIAYEYDHDKSIDIFTTPL